MPLTNFKSAKLQEGKAKSCMNLSLCEFTNLPPDDESP